MIFATLPNVDAHEAYINRELSWLAFARRVLEMAEDVNQPLLERVKFAGIMGMIFDEFVMKRLGGLHQKIKKTPARGPAWEVSGIATVPFRDLAMTIISGSGTWNPKPRTWNLAASAILFVRVRVDDFEVLDQPSPSLWLTGVVVPKQKRRQLSRRCE